MARREDVAPGAWREAVRQRIESGFAYFDFLTAVDESPTGLRLLCRLARPDGHDAVVLTTLVPAPATVVDSLVPVAPGAAWHERETAELFGLVFLGHPRLDRLLLSPSFAGHPLRKDFALAARAVAPWPGAAEEVDTAERVRSGGRRRVPPPGTPTGWDVPDA